MFRLKRSKKQKLNSNNMELLKWLLFFTGCIITLLSFACCTAKWSKYDDEAVAELVNSEIEEKEAKTIVVLANNVFSKKSIIVALAYWVFFLMVY